MAGTDKKLSEFKKITDLSQIGSSDIVALLWNEELGKYENVRISKDVFEQIAARAIGSVVWSLTAQDDPRLHLSDGSALSYDGDYDGFCEIMKRRNDAGMVPTCTREEYNTSVTATGSCGKFVFDDIARTLTLPLLTDFPRATTDFTKLGISFKDQLQGHKHEISGTTGGSLNTGSQTIPRKSLGGGDLNNLPGVMGNIITDDTHGTPNVGSETTPKGTNFFAYIVVANVTGDIDMASLKDILDRYVENVEIPKIKEAGDEAAAESKSWAIGEPTEPTDGSAKWWAMQAGMSVHPDLPLFSSFKMTRILTGSDAFGKGLAGSLVSNLSDKSKSLLDDIWENGESKAIRYPLNVTPINNAQIGADNSIYTVYRDVAAVPVVIPLSTANSWAIETEFIYTASVNSVYGGAANADFRAPCLGGNASGKLLTYLGNTRTNWNIANGTTSNRNFVTGQRLRTREEFKDGIYTVKSMILSNGETDWTTEVTINNTAKCSDVLAGELGFCNTLNTTSVQYPLGGPLYLEKTFIEINGAVFFQAVGSIPYKEKYGMRVINIADKAAYDAYYADRSVTGHFIYDPDTKQAYMPYPEKGKLIDSKRSNSGNISTWYRLYDTGYIEQGMSYIGSPGSDTSYLFNFPVEFKDLNVLSMGGVYQYTGSLGGVVCGDLTYNTLSTKQINLRFDTGPNGRFDFSISGYCDMSKFDLPTVYTYYKYADSIANSGAIDGDEVAAQVQENANNIALIQSTAFKMDDISADFTAGITITSGFTAPKSGWIYYQGGSNSQATEMKINGVRFGTRGDYYGQFDGMYFIGKGQIITWNYSSAAVFYPCKGG